MDRADLEGSLAIIYVYIYILIDCFIHIETDCVLGDLAHMIRLARFRITVLQMRMLLVTNVARIFWSNVGPIN